MDTIVPRTPLGQPSDQITKTPGIYLILNLSNGNCYVGSAMSLWKRRIGHVNLLRRNKHSNIHLQRAFNTYGEDVFEYQILEHVSSPSFLLEREQFWMDTLQPEYNINPVAGSNLGMHWSEETRRKMSLAQKGISKNKGRKASEEARRKMSVVRKGKRVSDEAKAKISAAKKGKKRSPETVERYSKARKGMPLSEQARKNMSEARKGKKRGSPSEETRRKIGDAQKGRKLSSEHVAKMSASLKGKPAWNKGLSLNEEVRAKMSDANTGKPWSPIRRAKFEEKRARLKNQQPSLWDAENLA